MELYERRLMHYSWLKLSRSLINKLAIDTHTASLSMCG